MSTPIVSVVMPLHNAAAYVSSAAQSVLSQEDCDLELIVVDDASTDDSADRVRAIGDVRLRLLRSEAPLNAAGARNLALAEARGEFVAFLDADDVAEPGRLRKQIQALRDDASLDLVASEARLIDATGSGGAVAFRSRPGEEIGPTLLFGNCLALSTVMARRRALRAFQPEFAPAEDYELWIQVAEKSRMRILPEPLVRYRVHAGSVSAREPERMRTAVARIHAAQLDRLGFREAPAVHGCIFAWPMNPNASLLAEAEAWLLALLAANDRKEVYARPVFRRVVGAFWFQACLDSWQLGWPVWDVYRRSPLAHPTFTRRALLLRRLLPQRFRPR